MVRRVLLFVCGALGLLLLAELGLRLLPVPQGLEPRYGFGTDRPLSYEPGRVLTYSRDWDFLYAQRGHANVQGYNGYCNAGAGAHKPAVWVVGDSFAEALMLDQNDATAARLQQLRPQWSVCNLGLSGAPASEYLAMLDAVRERAPARAWVLLMNALDIAESRDGPPGFHYFGDGDGFVGRPRPTPTMIVHVVQHSALLGYLRYNLKVGSTLPRLLCTLHIGRCTGPVDADELPLPPLSPVHREDAQRFAQALAARAAQRGVDVVVVINAPDPSRRLSQASRERERAHRHLLEAALRAAGIGRIVDIGATFAAAPECRLQGCYLFRDRHWTVTGHAVVADAVAAQLGNP